MRRLLSRALLSALLMLATVASAAAQANASAGTSGGQRIEVADQVKSITVSAASASCLSTNCVSLSLQGDSVLSISIVGAESATQVFESSLDGGTTFGFHTCYTSALVGATGTTNPGTWQCQVAGYSTFQVRTSVYTSGSPVVLIRASAAGNLSTIFATDAATSATAATVPAKAIYLGVRENTALAGLIQCDKFAQATISTATTTALVAVSASTTIYVCSYTIEIVGVATTAGTLQLEQGTGAACVTSPTVITPAWIGSTTAGAPWSVTEGSNIGYLFKTSAAAGLCALSTTTTVQKVAVRYAQF